MSKLQENDPIYYKVKIKELIKQALENGIEVYSSFSTHEELVFKGENGDRASINVFKIKADETFKDFKDIYKKKSENKKLETWLRGL